MVGQNCGFPKLKPQAGENVSYAFFFFELGVMLHHFSQKTSLMVGFSFSCKTAACWLPTGNKMGGKRLLEVVGPLYQKRGFDTTGTKTICLMLERPFQVRHVLP